MRNWTSSQRTTLTEFSDVHEVVDIEGTDTASACGRSLPPMVLDPGVVGGERGAGDEDQSEKREARSRQAMG